MRTGTAAQAARGMTDGDYDPEAVIKALAALRLACYNVDVFGHGGLAHWATGPDRPGTGTVRANTPRALGRLLTCGFGPQPS